MRIFILIIQSFIIILLFQTKSYALFNSASCNCDVQCTFVDGSEYSQSNSWTRRPNNNRYGGQQVTAREWNDCQAQCSAFASGINGAGLAAEKKACGPWKCTPTARVTSNKGKDRRGPQILTQATGNYADPGICTDDPEAASKPIFSYASKVLCGLSKPIELSGNPLLGVDRAVPGVYGAAVNVHNPHFEDVFFRWKVAPAGPNKDLGHSSYSDETVKPDNARYYDCPMLAKTPELFDGFMVIESDKPLDVTTYYTATKIDLSKPDNQLETVPAIDVETTKEREVKAPRNWGCKRSFKASISSPNNWVLEDGSAAIASGSSGTMSYAADAGVNGALKPGDYNYDYNFCLCEDGEAEISGNSLRTDDGVSVDLLPQPFGANNPVLTYLASSQSLNPPLSFTASSVSAGQNTLRLVVNQKDFNNDNVGNATSATIKGSIIIKNGYLGQCMARHDK